MLQITMKFRLKWIPYMYFDTLILNFLCLLTLIIHDPWMISVKKQRNLILTWISLWPTTSISIEIKACCWLICYFIKSFNLFAFFYFPKALLLFHDFPCLEIEKINSITFQDFAAVCPTGERKDWWWLSKFFMTHMNPVYCQGPAMIYEISATKNIMYLCHFIG